MHKSKKKKNVPKEVPSQLMELSNAQTRPNLGDGDFSSMSFQDAGNVIDRDENERLQFMNSKLSFSEGIDQVEVPSLMSVTSYFQQGSSFPVPYGNDSTMFPIDNGNVSSSLLGVSQSQLSQTLKPPSRNSSRRLQRSTSLKQESSRVSWGNITTRTLDDSSTNIGTNPKSAELERNDSLAKFFLGPQSDGMDKGGIIDYVLDYCKRRASYRLSDAPGIAAPPNQNNSGSSRTSGTSTKDRGIGDEEAVTAIRRPRPSGKTEDKTSDKRDEQASLVKPNVSSRKNSSIEDEDESIMLAEAGSTKENVLEVSELGGGNDGFEKFKKNLNHGRKTEDRYRKKLQSHHTEFETKRLNVDERYSHPKLSPNAFAGPGSTASLERPKKMMCNSPPEKLLQGRHENVIDNTPSPRPTQLRNSGGQCHSTPLVNESYIGKLVSTRKELNLERHFKPEGANLNYANFDKQKRPKMAESGSESSEGNSPGIPIQFQICNISICIFIRVLYFNLKVTYLNSVCVCLYLLTQIIIIK